MSKKYSASGEGYSSNDVTKNLNSATQAKVKLTIEINDAWRKAKSEDPSLEFKMSFLEFRKKYIKGLNRRS